MSLIEESHIRVDGGRIAEVNEGFVSEGLDLRDRLALPGLINAHTHIGDSFAKEAATGLSVHEAVGKEGVKWRLYDGVSRKHIIRAMRESAEEMLGAGITCFADFREGGIEGLRDLSAATNGLALRKVVLGRDLGNDLSLCDGWGLNLYQKDQAPPARARKNKILALHAGEVEGEIEEALRLDPDIIVHYTKADLRALQAASVKGISVVICPRSNAALRVGFPPVKELLESKVNVALGTDNVMINSPDLWREMEFLYKFACLEGGCIEPVEVLKMASVNAARALRLSCGMLAKGMAADIIFMERNAPNLRHTRDLTASLVSRAGPGNVRKVMIDGRFVVDKEGSILTGKT